MNKEMSIAPIQTVQELSLEALFAEGVELMQKLAGESWSDYNLHDPGVTLLEQLCFALTDIVYRGGIELKQLLTHDDNRLKLSANGLHSPGKVLPGGPVTDLDHQALLYDRLPDLGIVGFEADSNNTSGLKHLFYVPNPVQSAAPTTPETLEARILKVYHFNRPLCENLAGELQPLKTSPLELHGTLSIDEGENVLSVLAEVLLTITERIATKPEFEPYEDLLKAGEPLDQVLEGPLSERGRIVHGRTSPKISIQALEADLRQLDGVKDIRKLWLKDIENNRDVFDFLHGGPNRHFQLQQIKLDVRVLDEPVSINNELLEEEFNRKAEEHRQLQQNSLSHNKTIFPDLEQEYQDLTQSFPLKDQFPENYHFNRLKRSHSYSTENPAQFKQMNGYLMLFEQLVVNAFENLAHFKDLFSLTTDTSQSYHFQRLQTKEAQSLYRHDGTTLNDALNRVLSENDDFPERRNRALDYLLSIYAETFPDSELRRFNSYFTRPDFEYQLIRGKVQLLRVIPELGVRRGLGETIHLPAFHEATQPSGLWLKTMLQLGCESRKSQSLVGLFTDLNLSLTNAPQLSQFNVIKSQEITNRITKHFHPAITQKMSATFERPAPDVVDQLLENGALVSREINVDFLKQGTYPGRFKVGTVTDDDDKRVFMLVYRINERGQWAELGTFDRLTEAKQAAVQLHQLMLNLNLLSEGMHLVEHILFAVSHPSLPTDFLSDRISVFLPNWSVRFANPEFQKFAMEAVIANCPAHVAIDFYWLDFEQMQMFEKRYIQWRKALADSNESSQALHIRASGLIEFIHRQKKRSIFP